MEYLLAGISVGGQYALIAIGYTMVYGILRLINFAHGDIIMIGAYAGIVTVNQLGLPPIVAVIVSVVICAGLGMLIEFLAYKPLRQAPPLSVLITAIGVSYLLQNLALIIFGSQQKAYPSLIELSSFTIGGVTVDGISVLTLLMTALTSLVLAGALVVTWNYAAAQYRTAAETLLTQNFSAIVDRLDSADSVSDAWLADQEHNSGCLLFLWDNGAALHFAGTTGSADARNAVEPLLEEGLSPLLDTSLHDSSGAVQRQSAVFTLNEYRCHAALLPRGTAGSYLLVAALQDMGFVHRHAVQTVVQYGAIWFTGTLLLAIISWRLTGKALAPTALAMRRQKEFIAAAGHELRSPLAVVKASLDAACRTPVTERATLLRNAEQETDRMARLVEDLLVLANGDLDALPAHLHPIAPDNLCLEVYDAFFPLAQQRQHPLSLTLPEDSVPSIEADPDRVKQLLAILLNNAFDHTPAGTPVELCLTYCGEKITLAVQDHGPGIPDAEKARVFDRFYSADPSRTDKHNFGLGLSVAKELARLHHADLTVTDTPGGGAKFAVTFAARIS